MCKPIKGGQYKWRDPDTERVAPTVYTVGEIKELAVWLSWDDNRNGTWYQLSQFRKYMIPVYVEVENE